MELYTLTNRFLPRENVREFTSVIWTERYFSAGDVQLVVKAIPSKIDQFAKGTMLGLRGTKEIMKIDTQSIENGLLTVTGSSLPKFLNERQAWFENFEYDGSDFSAPLFAEYTLTATAGQIISQVVDGLVIRPAAYTSYWADINLDWSRDAIPGLTLGVVDMNGTPKRLSVPIGPLYDSIQKLAEEEGLGFKMYLDSASYTGTYVLKFATYRGKNRTSEQTSNLLVRLSPKLDSLTDVKEINSVSNYKNVFYVSYKNVVTTHYIPGLPIPTGFDRRVILVEAPDIFLEEEHIAAFREQVVRNTIANNVYIQSVDGQISNDTGYKFGTDYNLGDIIELEGFTGLLSKARVTEYIRSEDQFGEKAYPTLAVLDPLFVGYMPDLEPRSDFNTDWDQDPDWDFDFDPNSNDPNIKPSPKDPRDPPDHNPDPVPKFPDDDTGGGDDYVETGAPGGQLELHPDNFPADGLVRWYGHGSRIYLEGEVHYGVTGDPDGLITIEGGVPAEARPAVDTPITIYPDMPDSDSLYGHFTTFDGMVGADGTISISPAPLTSDEGFELYLMMGNISWPSGVSDTVAQEPLDQWLIQNLPFADPPGIRPAATSIGAKIGVHGRRVHLNGAAKLVSSTTGNLIQELPPKYRAARDDAIPILGGGGWHPGFVDDKGAVTLKQQKSKPLVRAASLNKFVRGEPWGLQPLSDPFLSYWNMPIDVWLGAADEGSMYLEGRWSPLTVPYINQGTEFGLIISYGVSNLLGGTLHYKVAAEKMENGELWLIITIYTPGNDELNDGWFRMPVARIDSDAFPGDIPNGFHMNIGIEQINPRVVQLSTNVAGTKYMVEWPQWDSVIEAGLPVWPSEIGAAAQWGAFYALVDPNTQGSGTEYGVSELTDITGDYWIPNNSTDYPTTWLPNHGYVQGNAQFNLDGLGWRVPYSSP